MADNRVIVSGLGLAFFSMCSAAPAADLSHGIGSPLAYCKPAHSVSTSDRAPVMKAPAPTTPLELDPIVFFQSLIDRYRGLHMYRDVVTVIQVTHRNGEESSRVESQIRCEVAQGKLSVQTPGSQARQSLGIDLPVKKSQPMQDAQQEYDLWLAPHMALKFTEQPLRQMRAGLDEAFIATDAESITIDNKKMVHVELRSGCAAEGSSASCAAKFDLYVNSDSMLIERIEGEQRLPNGASYSTTLQITPEHAESLSSEPVT